MRHVPHHHPDAALAVPLRQLAAQGHGERVQRLVAAVRGALSGLERDLDLDADAELAVRAALSRALLGERP